MSIPGVGFTKADGNTGVTSPGGDGIAAIIASSSTGTQEVATTYTRDTAVATDKGDGRLPAFCAYMLAKTKKPVVAVRPATSTAAAYGALTQTGTGVTVATADGTLKPYDAWLPYFVVVVGGTVGVSGITYKWSLDGGNTLSAETALGTATQITIPNSGVKINLTAATWVAGDTVSIALCSPPYPTTTDLVNSLEALRVTKQPWEMALIDAIATSTIATQLDTWLAQMELKGQFKLAACNTRMKNAGESEAAYQTAMALIIPSTTSIRVLMGADGGDALDWKQGVLAPRPTALALVARLMSIPIGTDPAEVDLGPIDFAITDARNNPKYHNEEDFEGLDVLRFSTLRTFDGFSPGTYFTNGRIISSGGSDYVYAQHGRTLNKASSLAWQGLTLKLSKGVKKSRVVGDNGERYIAETSAKEIEAYVNSLFTAPLTNQVDQVSFTLRRDDNIASNQGATVNGDVEIVALAYIKGFQVRVSFVKKITVTL